MADRSGDVVIGKRIENLYKTFKSDCNRCEYRKSKLLREIKACDRRKEKLKCELQRIMYNEASNKKNSGNDNALLKEEITLFNLFLDKDEGNNYR